VLLVWLAFILARPPYIYKVLLTTAVWWDHLVQILVGLLSLETSSSGSVLISCTGTFFVAPALAPIRVIPALKKGELCRLGRVKASRTARRINRGMLGNANEGAERWAIMLCRSKSDWGLSNLNAPSMFSGSEISISLCKLTCFRSLESNLFQLGVEGRIVATKTYLDEC
jgi:hypothetical protein